MGPTQAASECVLVAPFPVVERLVIECGHTRQFIIILLINARDKWHKIHISFVLKLGRSRPVKLLSIYL